MHARACSSENPCTYVQHNTGLAGCQAVAYTESPRPLAHGLETLQALLSIFVSEVVNHRPLRTNLRCHLTLHREIYIILSTPNPASDRSRCCVHVRLSSARGLASLEVLQCRLTWHREICIIHSTYNCGGGQEWPRRQLQACTGAAQGQLTGANYVLKYWHD